MVEAADGTIVEIDEMLPPAKKVKPDRKVKNVQSDTKYRHSADFKNMINGGKQGKKEKLHGHGFEWVQRVVKSTLCNERFRQTRSMHKHALILSIKRI